MQGSCVGKDTFGARGPQPGPRQGPPPPGPHVGKTLAPRSAMGVEQALAFMMTESLQAMPLSERVGFLRRKGVDDQILAAVMSAVQRPVTAPGEHPPFSMMNVEQAVRYLRSRTARGVPLASRIDYLRRTKGVEESVILAAAARVLHSQRGQGSHRDGSSSQPLLTMGRRGVHHLSPSTSVAFGARPPPDVSSPSSAVSAKPIPKGPNKKPKPTPTSFQFQPSSSPSPNPTGSSSGTGVISGPLMVLPWTDPIGSQYFDPTDTQRFGYRSTVHRRYRASACTVYDGGG